MGYLIQSLATWNPRNYITFSSQSQFAYFTQSAYVYKHKKFE